MDRAFWLVYCLSILIPEGALQEGTYLYSDSPCRYHRIHSENAHKWLPGVDGLGNVSLSVRCQSHPQQALVSWSNGGLPWLTLTVEYSCSNGSIFENTTTQVEDSTLHAIIPSLDTPSLATDSVTVNISENLGSKCIFFGCFEGYDPYLFTQFTFSTHTCGWTPETVSVTSTQSAKFAHTATHLLTTTARHLATASKTLMTMGEQVATRTPSLSLVGSASPIIIPTTSTDVTTTFTTSHNGSPSYQEALWFAPVAVLVVVAATLLLMASCYLVRRRIKTKRYKDSNTMFPDWRKAKINLNYNPVRVSTLYIDYDAQSVHSIFDTLLAAEESEALQDRLSRARELTEVAPSFTHCTPDSGISTESYMTRDVPGSDLQLNGTTDGISCLEQKGELTDTAVSKLPSAQRWCSDSYNVTLSFGTGKEYVVVEDSAGQCQVTTITS